ncbi:MAG: hypothetical protein J0I09_05695 [Sphingobacteriia bacterium]|nr:hypothetical protein [Sphingobacteriia bacterium]
MSVGLQIRANIFELNMQLEINDMMNIGSLQYEFNKLFPYLKLEFYEKDHANNKKVIPKNIYNNSRLLKEFIVSRNHPQFIIAPEMTVQQLAESFAKYYSLITKVFRRSGNVWLSTSVTDGWSLYEQNKQGELITAQMSDNRL